MSMNLHTANSLFSLLGGGLIDFKHSRGLIRVRELNKFLENFQCQTRYMLFENKEQYSKCLVYRSLSHSRASKTDSEYLYLQQDHE